MKLDLELNRIQHIRKAKLGYRTIYRVHMGQEPLAFHSYRDFTEPLDASAFMWAMAHVKNPERCWLWQGFDGWLRNDHMRGRPMPPSIQFKIEQFIAEDDLVCKELQNEN